MAVKLHASQDLASLFMAPVSDRDIFLWEFKKWRRTLWPYLLYAFALFAYFFSSSEQFWDGVWMAVPITLSTICFLVTVSVFLNLCQPILVQAISGVVNIGIILVWFLGCFLERPGFMKIVEPVTYGLNRLVPFGWLGLSGLSLMSQSMSFWWGVVALVALPALGFPALKRQLGDSYDLSAEGIDLTDGEEDSEPAGRSEGRRNVQTDLKTLTERIDHAPSGKLFQLPPFVTRGLLDRMLVAWLNPREHWLATMLLGGHVGLSGRLRFSAITIAVTSLIWWCAENFHVESLWIMGGVVGLIGWFPLLPFTSILGALNGTAGSGGASISSAAIVPVSSAELVKLDLKIMSLLTLANVPVILWLGSYVNWLLHTAYTGQTLAYCFGGLWSVLASRPIASAWSIANGTTRPTGRLARRFALSFMKWFTILFYLCLIFALAVLVNLSIPWTIGVALLQLGASIGYAAWFIRVYNRGWLSAEKYGVFEAEL
ncbi:hypothetical protein GC207_12885 [bacterium]|nr:hypothetical protein [bacterium]